MKRGAIHLAAAILAFACAAAAQARDAAGPMQACRADYSRLCASEKPGGGRVATCLKQHESELSPACQAALGGVAACARQAKQICGDAASGQGGMRECMKTHAGEFSGACRGAGRQGS